MMRKANPQPAPPGTRDPVPEHVRQAARRALEHLRREGLDLEREPEPIRFAQLTVANAVDCLARLRAHWYMRLSAVGLSSVLAQEHADNQWRESLPELTDNRSVPIYLACIAWGLRQQILEPGEAKLMVLLAKTQLEALRTCSGSDKAGPNKAGPDTAGPDKDAPSAAAQNKPGSAVEVAGEREGSTRRGSSGPRG
jgi:hypothetical protein